ncbi:hypothetical protein BCR37DRAFT_379239 [Protomyces lactucae-debilis]|uniref:Fe2OG dioxygenase domain-containing protein n=1 Tax=Protomyces lactucae-debilis TaxID=2754530 RepID=A0A1Y2FH36_PROLT|nr:uncharacterized protein BCR37DRAFT_379239 [Protomyces lactucae-debilis]ORY83233.1 hypothetical protein BCR37DRAFT_379239 [Protomyces lactucae-debilis]
MHSEKLDPATQRKGDFKEAFNLDVSSNAHQPLPRVLQAEKAVLAEFEACCRQVTTRLLDLLALGLGKEPDFFSSKHNASKPSGTVLRLLYYPAIDERFEQGDIRAGAHTDYGTLTLLFVKAGGSGLEVRPPYSATDAWQAIPPPAEARTDEDCVPILVNVADQLELWTDGLLKSTLHRVMATADKGDRYSIAYFCHPDDDTVLSMKPNETNRAVREEEITAGEHLKRRLAATYEY